MWSHYPPYVPVAQRRAQAAREVARRTKKGQAVSPVVIEGTKIAKTFWGKAWCDNLESYSDYANRLPRGRTYVRNGSVIDLQIAPGRVTAMVSGSEIYEIEIDIDALSPAAWSSIKKRCAGQVGSLVDLVQGKLAKGVIEVVTGKGDGLFPKPKEIRLSCSCPDGAYLCKHLAAVMYGVGARLDQRPELLFELRKVDHLELIEEAVSSAGKARATTKKTVAAADLAGVFGIEMDDPAAEAKPAKKATPAKKPPAQAKMPVKKATPAEKVTPAKKIAEHAPPAKAKRAPRAKKDKGA